MNPTPDTKLEELEKSIYRRDGVLPHFRRDGFSKHESSVAREWNHAGEEMPHEEVIATRMSLFTKIFLAAFAFFLLTAAFGAYVIFGGSNTVSSTNVAISVLGPVSVSAGDPLSLDVTVQNKNPATLTGAELVVEYPAGTKSPDNPEQDLTRQVIELGTLPENQLLHQSVKALLFGEEKSVQTIKFSVQYHLAGSNALFYADSPYAVTISSSPVGLTVTSLKEVTSGQSIDLAVDVVSNSATTLHGMILTAEYPFGFTPTDYSLKPVSGNSVWLIGDLAPAAHRTIHIRGPLSGQDGENRVFKFSAGTASSADPNVLGTSFVDASQPISIQKPFIGIATTLNGVDAKNYAASPGKPVNVQIAWKNNTQNDIDSAEITVKLNGDLFDKTKISATSGFYRSSDNTIVWNKSTAPELGTLAAGSSGTLNFSFSTLPTSNSSGSVKNPQVSFDVSASGKRLGETGVPERVAAADTRTVKLTTTLGFISRGVYSVGPFQNTGPYPPKADKLSTYTVIWSLTNTSNAVSNPKVSAVLPSYVTWQNVFIPTTEKITFDPVTREIAWYPGTIPANAGIAVQAREVGFQIGFEPSIGQVGTAPILMGASTVTGLDSWSGAQVGATQPTITTKLENDPNFANGEELVVK